MDRRDKDILKEIVRRYILTGEPVASNAISKKKYGVSPATIRNIMAKLVEQGFLTQPHPSSGRVPTDLAYRFYVDTMIAKKSFSVVEADTILSELLTAGNTFPELFMKSSRVLSKLSNNIGVVLSPDMSSSIFEHIDFIRLAYRKLMVLFIAKHGLLSNRVIEIDEDYSQSELNRISAYLVNRMQGKTLGEVRDEITLMMHEDKKAYDAILRNAAMLAYRYFDSDMGGQDLFLEGMFNLLDKPEFSDADKMKALFKAFEEKSRIVKLLNSCLEGERINVLIGSENLYPEMSDCSVITSNYAVENRLVGVVGIIGPKRMEYGKIISLVDSLSHLIGSITQKNSETKGVFGKKE